MLMRRTGVFIKKTKNHSNLKNGVNFRCGRRFRLWHMQDRAVRLRIDKALKNDVDRATSRIGVSNLVTHPPRSPPSRETSSSPASASRGGIDVILNESSQRLTPYVIATSGSEARRTQGNEARCHVTSPFHFASPGFSRSRLFPAPQCTGFIQW